MIRFLLYKIYTSDVRRDDYSPFERAFTYTSINMILLNFSVFLIIQGFLELWSIKLLFLAWIPTMIKYFFFLGAVPFTATYFLLFYKKSIAYYEQKYRDHWLNNVYFSGLLFIVPFFLFFLGPVLRVLLFGGYMLGKDYVGYLNLVS